MPPFGDYNLSSEFPSIKEPAKTELPPVIVNRAEHQSEPGKDHGEVLRLGNIDVEGEDPVPKVLGDRLEEA